MNKTIKCITFALLTCNLFAQYQGPIVFKTITRKNNNIIYIKNNKSIQEINKNFKIIQSIPMPEKINDLIGVQGVFTLNDKIYISFSDYIDSGLENRYINYIWSFSDKKWDLEIKCDASEKDGGYRFVFPLKNGNFLSANRRLFKRHGDLESIFNILQSDARGKWSRHHTVDAGIHPKAFDYPGPPLDFHTAQVGDYLAVADPHPGYIWLFHQEDGRLKRLVRLYDDIDLKRLEKNDFSSAMLGIQPTEDGLLLIAARPESTVLNDDFSQRARSGMQGLEAYQEIRMGEEDLPLLIDYAWKHHPEVVWMTLDPETGSLKTLDPPPEGAKTEIHSWFEAQSFHWIPTWDGAVVFEGLEQAIEEARQREAKAEAGRRANVEPALRKAGE